MAHKSKRQESCVFEFDQIEVWGPELTRLFKDALPKRLKQIFEAEPPDDMEHAREILLAHLTIERAEIVDRLWRWIGNKRVAAYFGAWVTDGGEPKEPSELSLSRTPFEQFFDAYVPIVDPSGANPCIVRVLIDGGNILNGEDELVDGLPNVVSEILAVWSYWLADPQFSPADECLFIRVGMHRHIVNAVRCHSSR